MLRLAGVNLRLVLDIEKCRLVEFTIRLVILRFAGAMLKLTINS